MSRKHKRRLNKRQRFPPGAGPIQIVIELSDQPHSMLEDDCPICRQLQESTRESDHSGEISGNSSS
jgi:hypothetical protein